MPAFNSEVERRRIAALAAIQNACGTSDEVSTTLFVSHHLNELGDGYWIKHCGVRRPTPRRILGLLVLRCVFHMTNVEVDVYIYDGYVIARKEGLVLLRSGKPRRLAICSSCDHKPLRCCYNHVSVRLK